MGVQTLKIKTICMEIQEKQEYGKVRDFTAKDPRLS